MALAIGGLPGVLIAAFIVKDMPLEYVRWLVVGVVLIAATMMLRSAARRTSSAYAYMPRSCVTVATRLIATM